VFFTTVPPTGLQISNTLVVAAVTSWQNIPAPPITYSIAPGFTNVCTSSGEEKNNILFSVCFRFFFFSFY
jgi:hypothetical protein